MRTKKQIYLVYDFSSNETFMPNCLDHRYSEIIFKEKGFINHHVTDYYFENYKQIPNLRENLNVSEELIKNITIWEYENDDTIDKENSIFLYAVEPFANIDHILGTPNSFTELPYLEHISEKAYNHIKYDSNFYLIVSYANEGTIFNVLFDYLYNILERYHIPFHKFIFTMACADIEQHHQKYFERNPTFKDTPIKTFYWTWSLREKVDECLRIESKRIEINQDGSPAGIVSESELDSSKIRNKKFLMFNRRMRPHRVLLTSLLGNDFNSRNYISYDYNYLYNEVNIDFFKPRIVEEYQEQGFNNLKEIIEKRPLSVIDFEKVHDTVGFGFERKEPYLDSYIHILSETNFEEPGVYFSEKTWKPVLNLQPFIMLNYHNSLKYFKDMGFKTFTPYINEDYDNEEDPRVRMKMIYEEIKRLDNLDIKELHEIYYNLKDILIHNKKLALQYTGDYLLDVESNYLNSIIDYVESN